MSSEPLVGRWVGITCGVVVLGCGRLEVTRKAAASRAVHTHAASVPAGGGAGGTSAKEGESVKTGRSGGSRVEAQTFQLRSLARRS